MPSKQTTSPATLNHQAHHHDKPPSLRLLPCSSHHRLKPHALPLFSCLYEEVNPHTLRENGPRTFHCCDCVFIHFLFILIVFYFVAIVFLFIIIIIFGRELCFILLCSIWNLLMAIVLSSGDSFWTFSLLVYFDKLVHIFFFLSFFLSFFYFIV